MLIKLKDIHFEDFVNYQKPSMFIIFPKCSFKCDKENGCQICQNWSLQWEKEYEIKSEQVADLYIKNHITKAIVCGGLEPFDTPEYLFDLVFNLRRHTQDDIVIYTGYNEDEISDYVKKLSKYENIIIKFGRFVPNQVKHYDDTLGISLASDNQYAKKIS